MAHKPSDGAVLNAIQPTAADIVFGGGKLQLNDGSSDLLKNALKISEGTSYTKTAYTAGVAQVDRIDFGTAILAANSQYRVAIQFPKDLTFNNVQVREDAVVSGEANQLVAVREYVVWTGDAAPTANSLRDDFIARISADNAAGVTAASGGAGIVTLTMNDVNDGQFTTTASDGATVETGGAGGSTAYVAPAGTPAIVEADFAGQSSPSGTYTTWEINFTNFRRSNVVSGAVVGYPEYMTIYAEEADGDFATFAAALDAILDGTHTPVSDYLGI